jgi:hypothetical protein
MTNITKYGDVLSSALSFTSYDTADSEINYKFALLAGEIVEIYTVDNDKNTSGNGNKNYTTYDVMCTLSDGATEVLRGCQALQPFFGGGINNYMEVIPTTPSMVDNPLAPENLKRGHRVLVGFIDGFKGSGVILGSLPHSSPIAKGKRPKSDDGVVTRLEIQGLMVEVNNDGEFTLQFNGAKNDLGISNNPLVGPTSVKIDKEGKLQLITKADKQLIELDPSTFSPSIQIYNDNTSIKMNAMTGKVIVDGNFVEIGSGSLEPQVCGDSLVSLMEELIDEISNLIVPTGVGPSGPPQNAAKFAIIKQKLKTALSTKHKVAK